MILNLKIVRVNSDYCDYLRKFIIEYLIINMKKS